MKRHWLRQLVILAVLALMAAACGGDGDTTDDAEPSAEPTPAEEAEDEQAPETEDEAEPVATEDEGAGTEEAAAPDPVETVTLPVVQSVDSLTFLPVYAALTQGFYAEEGIELEITLGGVGGREMQALIGEEVDVALSAGTELVKVAAQGRDVLAIQAMGQESAFAAMIHPDVAEEVGFDDSWSLEQRLEVLDGRVVGISSPGALSDTIARYWIQQAGLSPDADVQIVATGPPTGGVAALQQGDVDILMSWSPFAEQIQAEGIGELFIDARRGEDPSLSPWLEQVIVTRGDFAAENADVLSRLVRATTRGNAWILESDVETIVDMLGDVEAFQALDRDVLTPAVEAMKDSFSPDGATHPEQLENIARVLMEGGVISQGITPEDHIDNSFLQG